MKKTNKIWKIIKIKKLKFIWAMFKRKDVEQNKDEKKKRRRLDIINSMHPQ